MTCQSLALSGLLVLSACGGGVGAGSPSPASPSPASGSISAADLQHCADVINGLRATVGKRALTRSPALETFGATAARNDAQSGLSHQYYQSTNGAGVSLAENEVIGWSLTDFKSIQGVVDRANTDLFWKEGPGGGHYQNIVGPWTEVGCGFAVTNNAVTYTTEFH